MAKPLHRARGFPDHLPKALSKHKKIISKAFEVAKRFCFEPVETPVLEPVEVFKRALQEGTVVTKEMYIVKNSGEELALRPEGTASIARMFITEKLENQLPLRFIYSGPLFRHERPQKGRFRQFTTVGIEILGEANETADIETLTLAWIFLQELNLNASFSLEINTIGSSEERKIYIQKLLQYFKPLKKKLSKESQERLERNPLRILDSKQEEDQDLLKTAPLIQENLSTETLKSYRFLKEQLQAFCIPFIENPYLVRGLDYYNHLVFEIKSPQLGAQAALLAGGRYDGLMKSLGGSVTPAVGWGAGVERLALLCEETASLPPEIALVAVGENPQNKAFQKAYSLRKNGHSVYFKFTGNFSKQMKRVSGKGCLIALIFGEKEVQTGTVTLKDLNTGKQHTFKEENLKQELKSAFRGSQGKN